MKKLIKQIENEIKHLHATFRQQFNTDLTNALKRKHEAAKKCHICLKEFDNAENKKVKDHCYYTGLYRATIHNDCRIKCQIPGYILIMFNNLSSYIPIFNQGIKKKFQGSY